MLPPAAEHQTKAIAMDVKLFGKSRVAGQGSHRSEVGKVVILILFRRVEERVFRSSSWKPIDPLAPVVASPWAIRLLQVTRRVSIPERHAVQNVE